MIAKSFGTIVAVRAWAAGSLAPARALLVGIPVDGLGAEDAARLAAFVAATESLCVQQRDDVTGSAAALRALVGPDAALREVSGSDHRYALAEVLPALADWPGA